MLNMIDLDAFFSNFLELKVDSDGLRTNFRLIRSKLYCVKNYCRSGKQIPQSLFKTSMVVEISKKFAV